MANEPCTPHFPVSDCAGCAFMPRPHFQRARQAQLRAHEEQKRQEREFAFERRQPTEEFA